MRATETAIILIEFQNDFCKEGGKLHGMVRGELERQKTIDNGAVLLKGARQRGCLVIHCPFVYDKVWAEGQGVCGIIAGAGQQGAFQPDSWGAALIDELAPTGAETVLSGKHALSAFSNTDLDDILQEKGIRTLVVAGMLSNVCVEATARSAYDRGYQVVAVRDAMATTSQANQQYVEREVYPLVGRAMSVAELLAALE